MSESPLIDHYAELAKYNHLRLIGGEYREDVDFHIYVDRAGFTNPNLSFEFCLKIIKERWSLDGIKSIVFAEQLGEYQFVEALAIARPKKVQDDVLIENSSPKETDIQEPSGDGQHANDDQSGQE